MNRLGDVAEHRFGLITVFQVEQGTDQQARRAPDQHSQRPSQDADEQTQDAAGGRALQPAVSDFILDDDASVLVPRHHGSGAYTQLTL